MSLFIAIQFTESLRRSLEDLQNRMRIQGVTGNYTRSENLHLTLAFIGDYGDPCQVLDVIESADFRPFELQLEGVGTFGDLFWAGIRENKELTGYVKRLRRALSDAGIPYDRKKFSPHITLIRKVSYRNGKAIPVTESPKGKMKVGRISLMRSERGRIGMVYTEIER